MHPQIEIKSNVRTPLIGIGVLALLALLLPHRTWTIMLVTLSGLIGLSYAWIRALSRQLTATRQVNARWVAVGDWLSETFTLTNDSLVPLLWAEVTDQSNVPGYRAASVRAAGVRQQIRWREQAICERRGRFQLGPWSLRTGDPFGLFELTIHYADAQEIVIYPPIHTALPVPLPSGFGRGSLRTLRRHNQALVNVASVRDYRPNDPYNHIHWRSTAKQGRLLVRQFDEDTGGDVWLLVDLFRDAQVGQGQRGTEEHAVLLAASLAAQALTIPRSVGLAAYGAETQLLTPAHGEGQRWQILRSLALVSAETATVPLRDALADVQRLVKRGAALLLISADLSADWLPAVYRLVENGVSVHCTLFDVDSFAPPDDTPATSARVHIVQHQLNRLDIPSTVVQQGEVGQRAENKRSNREFVYTPLGRAIVRGEQ